MQNRVPPSIARGDLKRHVLSSMRRYWPINAAAILGLPVNAKPFPKVVGPLRLVFVMLPEWASDCGIAGQLAVPREVCIKPEAPSWENVDWWLAAFLLLESWHERVWEVNNGPIHSYSFRLNGWDHRVWKHAWVNRIALFVRRWAVRQSSQAEDEFFGALPEPEFIITHDVDAVSKTVPIRFKQGAFNLFNAGRAMSTCNIRLARARLAQAVRFLFSTEDWWTFNKLIEYERKAGVRCHFNFFFDNRPKTLLRWLFDPNYDISAQKLSKLLKTIHEEGGCVGVHPTFDAWKDSTLIRVQREGVESVLGSEVVTCRQHWLRFAWESTWAAQSEAGIQLDTTLMFNDRPGFRCAAATNWMPWNVKTGQAHNLSVLPTVLMDSHLYDYQQLTDLERRIEMLAWVEEVRAVSGQIAVVWHPHTLTEDYGWAEGFATLIDAVRGKAV